MNRELEPSGNEGAVCWGKMQNWEVCRQLPGDKGVGVLPYLQVSGGSGGPSFYRRKAEGMFTGVAKWIGRVTYERPQCGRAQVGGRGEQKWGA